MSDIRVQVGYGRDSMCALDDASDEWIWMRIFELREHGLCSQFKLSFVLDGELHVFASPRLGEKVSRERVFFESPFLEELSELWDRSGLNEPGFTAGAAVLFVRRLRSLSWVRDFFGASLASA